MPIVGIGEAAVRLGAPSPRSRPAEKSAAPISGRSLVPVMLAAEEPPSKVAGVARSRPSAPFLAQMIATRLGLPQTRAKRRGSFGQAAALYVARRPAAGGARILSASA